MPLYDIECARGHRSERMIPLAQFEEPIICSCGSLAHRCITRPMVLTSRVDYSYACPITGQHISSKNQHEENLKRHGCRVRETGESEYHAKQRADADAAFERSVEHSVERTIEAMPGEKRELLGKALSGGAVADVVRA